MLCTEIRTRDLKRTIKKKDADLVLHEGKFIHIVETIIVTNREYGIILRI